MVSEDELTTQRFVEGLWSVGVDELSEAAVFMAKRLTADLVGIAVAGQNSPQLDRVVEFVRTQYAPGAASVFGYADGVSPVGAAFANGTTGHGHDFDDTYEFGTPVHSSSSVVPAALALGQQVDASGAEVVRAVALGVGTHARLASVGDNVVAETGWHPSAVYGTFGATIAGAQVLDLSVEETVHALGIAYAQTAGNMQATLDKAVTKRFQPGHASLAGVTAALLARDGLTATADPLAGDYGFSTCMSASTRSRARLRTWGDSSGSSDFRSSPTRRAGSRTR